jgi:hypothetical protein
VKSARALFPALVAIALGAECRAQAAGGNDTPPVDAGAQLLGIVGLAATPDITASRLEPAGAGDLDGQRIDTVRLANEVSLSFGDGDLYLEGNLGFARANVDLRLGDGVVEANRFDAVGAFGAIGPDLHLRRFLHVRPLLIIGAGYVDDDFGLPEALEDEAEATVDLRQWSLATGFGLSIDYERPVGVGSVDLRLKLSQVFFDTLWSADPRFAIDATNRTINTSAVYKHDTGLRIRSYPLLVTGLLGANAFLGDQRDALGFAWFGEYGGGLELDLSRADARVQRARVRVTGIAGDGVTGISLGVGVGF